MGMGKAKQARLYVPALYHHGGTAVLNQFYVKVGKISIFKNTI